MFFAPSGSLHAIRNAGGDEAEFVLAFSHELPEDFGLRAAFGAMSRRCSATPSMRPRRRSPR